MVMRWRVVKGLGKGQRKVLLGRRVEMSFCKVVLMYGQMQERGMIKIGGPGK